MEDARLSRLKEDFAPTALPTVKALSSALGVLPEALKGEGKKQSEKTEQRVLTLQVYGGLAVGVEGMEEGAVKDEMGEELGSHWEDNVDFVADLLGRDDKRTVHAVCSAVLATARALGTQNFEISLAVLFPPLLKQASSSLTTPQALCAHACLEGCIVACPSPRILSHLSNAAANPDPIVRERASQYFLAVVNGWPDDLLQHEMSKISTTITCRVLLDAHKAVKNNGRICVRHMLERFPDETRELLESLDEDTLTKLGVMLGEDIMAALSASPPPSPQAEQPPPLLFPPDLDPQQQDEGDVAVSIPVPDTPPSQPARSGSNRSLGSRQGSGPMSPPTKPAQPVRSGSYKLARQRSGPMSPPSKPTQPALSSPPHGAGKPVGAGSGGGGLMAPSNARIRRASSPAVDSEKPRRQTLPPKEGSRSFREKSKAPRMSLRPPSSSEHDASAQVSVVQREPMPAGLQDAMVVPETSLEYNMLSKEIDLNAQAMLELWLLSADTSQRAGFHLKADHAYLATRKDQLQVVAGRMRTAFDVRDPWYRQRYMDRLDNEIRRVQSRQAEVEQAVANIDGLHHQLMSHVVVNTRRAVERERAMQRSAIADAQERFGEALASVEAELANTDGAVVAQKLNDEAGGVECLPTLWQDAHHCKTKYMDPFLDELASQLNLKPDAVRKHPLTTAAKALEQLFVEKGSDDFRRMCDVVRGTVTCAEVDELLQCLRFVLEDNAISVLSSENGLSEDHALSHHDVVLYLRFKNDRTSHVGELRLQLAAVRHASRGTEQRKFHLATRLHLLDEDMTQADWSKEVLVHIGAGFARTVNLNYAEEVGFGALAAALMSEGSRVESISLMGCFPDADQMEENEKGEVRVSDGEFVRAHKQTRLVDLNLNLNAGLGDKHLGLLKGCVALRSVELRECDLITDAGLTSLLATTRALRYLDVSNCSQITDGAVEALVQHTPELRTLLLNRTRVANTALVAVGEKCPLIQVLQMGRTKVTDAGLEQFAQSKPRCLQELDVGWTKMTDFGVNLISEGCAAKLERLKLYNTRVTDRSLLEVLSTFKGLRQLDLGNTQVGDGTAKGIAAHCKRLRVLGLTNTKVTDAGVEAVIVACGELEELQLNGTGISDAVVARLAEECPDLREVGLYHTKVADEGFSKLVICCKRLRLVDLLHTEVSEEQVESVRQSRPNITIFR